MTQILANEIVITTFSLVPVKYGINHTAAMGIFVWAVKQVWYYIYLVLVKLLICDRILENRPFRHNN